MKIEVGISNKHVHLTKEDYCILFGDMNFEVRNELKQPGMFASNLTVSIKGSKRSYDNVRVLGPCRSYTQVEVSKTDSYYLGVNPPVRDSGNLSDAEEITIIGPMGSVTRKCCIIPTRHIHLTKEMYDKYSFNSDIVSIKIDGDKSGIINNVHLKITDEAYFELHLDTDDANAFLLKNDDLVDIIQ